VLVCAGRDGKPVYLLGRADQIIQ